MNVYDFDNTILRGDSSARFFAYCLKHYPKMWLDIPIQALNGLAFVLRLRPKQMFKQRMFSFLRLIDNVDKAIDDFWLENFNRIKPWYYENHKVSDVIISASPEFLIAPACKKLKIKYVIGSRVDKHSGKFSGKNCHGAEKVNRFREMFPAATIDEFYSDSYSDSPLAELAKQAFLVKGDRLLPWNK